MRKLLTFEARALGSKRLLRYPLYPSQHTHARCEDGFGCIWDRCICLLRPPSTSGYATRSPSSSPGEPGEGAGFPGLELALLRAQRGQKLPPKRGRLGGEPRRSAAVAWPGSPSVRGRTGSNQPPANSGGGGSYPSLCPDGQHGVAGEGTDKTGCGELNYFGRGKRRSHSTQAPSAGREQGGCSGCFCQTQGATERGLPGSE